MWTGRGSIPYPGGVASARTPLVALIARFAAGLRFPVLFWITAGLFALDLAVPDVVPFADEILLALGTLVLGGLRRRAGEAAGDDEAQVREDGA